MKRKVKTRTVEKTNIIDQSNSEKNLRKVRQVIYTLLWVGVMVLIFWFSGRNAEKSEMDSGSVVSFLNIIGIEKLFPELAGSLDFIVRKCAHFFIYTCLGLTGVLAIRSYLSGKRGSKMLPEQLSAPKSLWTKDIISCIAALLWGFLYACSDEWHQTFVPGRDGAFRDVIIDTAGVSLGVFVMWTIGMIKYYTSEKRK